MSNKNKDGECAPSKVSPEVAEERKRQAASLFDTGLAEGTPCNNGTELRMKVKRICISVRNSYKFSGTYSAKDLYQDVMLRFWKSLPRYRGEADLTTVIRRIAVNQLIDKARKERWSKKPSDAKSKNSANDTRAEEDFVVRSKRGPREIGHFNGAEHQYQSILVHEIQKTWTDTELFIWNRFVAGQRVVDTAAILGITPQAVSKRKKRLIHKTRKLLEGGANARALSPVRATA